MSTIEALQNSAESIGHEFERGIALEHSKKKAFAKTLMNSAGIFVGVFLVFAVVIIVTTDIRLASWEELANLGIDFLLLFFCSYSMYITCSDSGMRHGLGTEEYKDGCKRFEETKKIILGRGNQSRMYEFCRHYAANELKNTKMEILAVVGFKYEEYIRKYLGVDEEIVNECNELSKAQKKAINKANKIKPIRLTPEMILKRGRHAGRRSPLGMDPETNKKIHFGTKLVTTFLLVGLMTIIIVDIVVAPTWVVIAGCMLKMIVVITNGFSGYKLGYENIVFDTTNYMSDQTDLMEQAIHYFEKVEDKIDGNKA